MKNKSVEKENNFKKSFNKEMKLEDEEEKKKILFNKDKNNNLILKLRDIYFSLYEDKIHNLLFLTKSELMDSIEKQAEYAININYSKEEKDSNNFKKVIKSIRDKIEEQFIKDYNKINKALIDYKKNPKKFQFLKRYIKHCLNDDSFAFHLCKKGEDFGNFIIIPNNNDDKDEYSYVVCVKCKICYLQDYIKIYCTYCDCEYYSTILKPNEDANLLPATWEKYHCTTLVNEVMKCVKCRNTLYINLETGILQCLNEKCKLVIEANKILWKCIYCSEEFKSEAKIYNPVLIKQLKKAVKWTLLLKVNAFPESIPCCNVPYKEIKNYHYYHYKNGCIGELYSGIVNKREIVVCSRCHAVNYRNQFLWTCPLCKNQFSSDSSKSESFRNSFLLVKKENKKNIMKNRLSNHKEKEMETNSYNNTNKKITHENNNDYKINEGDILTFKTRNLIEGIEENNKPSDVNSNSQNEEENKLKKNFTQFTNEGEKNYKKKLKLHSKVGNLKKFAESETPNFNFSKLIGNEKKYQDPNRTNNSKSLYNNRPYQHKFLAEILTKGIENENNPLASANFENLLEKFKVLQEETPKNSNLYKVSSKLNYKLLDESENKLNTNDYYLYMNHKDDNSKGKANNSLVQKIMMNNYFSNDLGSSDKRKIQPFKSFNDLTPKKINNYITQPNKIGKILNLKKFNQENNINTNEKQGIFQKNFNETTIDTNKSKELLIKYLPLTQSLDNLNSKINISNRENKKFFKRNVIYRNECKENNIENNTNLFNTKDNKIYLRIKENCHKNLMKNLNYNKEKRNEEKLNNYEKNKINFVTKEQLQEISNSCIIPKFEETNFSFIKPIGEGSYGIIYLVKENEREFYYALKKVICKNLNEIIKTKNEFELIYSINHVNVMKIYKLQFKYLDQTTYSISVLMEKAKRDWNTEIKHRKILNKYYSESEIINILKQLTFALCFLQIKGIAHRDIKPENILIFEKNLYKISDLGEAANNHNKTQNATLKGSELFMSPILFYGLRHNKENIKHNVFKSDVFSTGYCFLFAMSLDLKLLEEIKELKDLQSIKNTILKYIPNKKYSFKLMNTLYKMIEIEESQRPDFIELKDYLNKNF